MRGLVPLRLSLRYWRAHPTRALIMLTGLVTTAALLAAVLLVNDSLARTYAGWERGVTGWTEIEVRATADEGFEGAWLDAIRDVPGVGAAAPVVERHSYVMRDSVQVGVNVRGVDPLEEEQLRPFSIVAGRALEEGDAQVALLSYAASIELDARPGVDVELLTPGGMELLRVVGVYQPLDDGHGALERAVLLVLPQAQALFQGGRNALTRVDVATDGSSVQAVEADLGELMAGRAIVRGADLGVAEMAAASRELRLILLLAGVLSALAAGVLLAVQVRTMVDERRGDLRLLHVLGVSRRRLRTWLTVEVALVVGLASLPALGLAAPLARLALQWLPTDLLPFAANVAAPRLGPSILSPTFALLLVGALALLLTLRYLFFRLFGWAARAATGSESVAPWLRVAGHLARRRVGTSATVAAALALSSAGLIGIQGASDANRHALMAWLEGAVKWDLLVASAPASAGATVTLPQAALSQVAAVPGVAAVAAERQVAVTSRGRPVTMIALGGSAPELSGRLSVVHAADLSGSAVWADLQGGRGVALTVPLAERLQVGVGDRLPLASLSGDREFTVIALVDDARSGNEAAYIALDNYAAVWGDHGVDSIEVRISPGADVADVARQVGLGLPEHPAKVPLHVTLAEAYRTDQLTAAADTYRAARLGVLLALLVSLAALLTSSLAAAWQAEPELAGLRAMGVPRPRLVRVLFANLAFVGAVSAIPGMLLGTLLSRRVATGSVTGDGMAGVWPLDAYASVLALLLITALLAAALLLTSRAGVSLQRQPRR